MIFSHSRQRYSGLRAAALLITTVASVSLAACDGGSRPKYEQRLVTDDFVIRVSVESLPVRALETIRYRVVVSDVKTGKPIENGEGRIYATNADRKTTANGLEATGELGTYRSTLFLVTSGLWAMAVQFRRDSTQKLQATPDWTQDVQPGFEPGDIQTPTSNRLNADSVKKADSARADSTKKADSAKKTPPAGKP
ncbi:MAG: hypothetical protein ABI852_21980 [Gemmatimonadaceae bacterium]